ncbi:hypothetical protein AMECASPLE_021725, partial [Ameca splendens]
SFKSKASEGDWMENQADRMLIGRLGDTQKSHWVVEVVKRTTPPSHTPRTVLDRTSQEPPSSVLRLTYLGLLTCSVISGPVLPDFTSLFHLLLLCTESSPLREGSHCLAVDCLSLASVGTHSHGLQH